MSILDKIKQDAIPSLIAGAVSIPLYSFILGNPINTELPFFSMTAPAWAVVGGTVTLSQLLGNVLENQVLPYIPQNQYASQEAMIVKPTLTGLAVYGISYLGISNETSFIRTFGLGAGSSIVGDYTSRLIGY